MTAPVITVYCDGPPDHPHPRYVIDQYRRHRVGDQAAWLPLERWSYRGATGRTAHVTQRYFLGAAPQERTPDVTSDDFRMQFVLFCPECNFNEKRDMSRGKDFMAALFDVFDRMESGVSYEIGVRLLATLVMH